MKSKNLITDEIELKKLFPSKIKYIFHHRSIPNLITIDIRYDKNYIHKTLFVHFLSQHIVKKMLQEVEQKMYAGLKKIESITHSLSHTSLSDTSFHSWWRIFGLYCKLSDTYMDSRKSPNTIIRYPHTGIHCNVCIPLYVVTRGLS